MLEYILKHLAVGNSAKVVPELMDEVARGEVTPPIAAGPAPDLVAEFEVDWGVADADGSGLCASASDPKIATIAMPRTIAIQPPI